ncbi:MAG: hypothetical protein EZS28_043848, partial [Streblomastix strix]
DKWAPFPPKWKTYVTVAPILELETEECLQFLVHFYMMKGVLQNQVSYNPRFFEVCRPIQKLGMLGYRPDAELVNALTWLKSNGGVKYKSKIKSLRTHGFVVLSQFSRMPDISHSPLIVAFSKGLGMQTIPKAKNPTTWNLQILFDYIQTTKFCKIEEKQQVAMALVVAFSAARMTQLVLMKISEMQIMRNQISVKTQTSKGKNKIDHTITFKQRTGLICSVRALRVWLDERRSLKLQSDSLWWNLSKNNTPNADNCSHMLTEIIRKAGVPEKYSGPTIRHAMMTKLRACGATQAEVNAYTRHSLTSNVVDAYYFRPVERDLGALLLSNEQSTFKNDDYIIVSILPEKWLEIYLKASLTYRQIKQIQ